MTLKNKLLISTIILTILTCGTFIIYKQIEISNRQKAIEESIIAQKNLSDNLVRSMSSYATADQIESYIKNNKVDLGAIEKDIQILKAKIDSVNTVVTQSFGYDWHDLESDGVKPGANPPKVDKITCEGKEIDCLKDPHGYLSNQQTLKLNEKFKGLDVPFGSVTFDGTKSAPWDISVLSREYSTIIVNAKDENGKISSYNQFKIIIGDKEYKIPVDKATVLQTFPDPIFRWWSPRLYLGVDGGLNISKLDPEFGPNINLAIMNYGRYVQNPEFSILQLGFGLGLNNKSPYFVLTPFAYNIGKHLPFMMNTYIGPSLQVSTSADIAAMVGLRIGL